MRGEGVVFYVDTQPHERRRLTDPDLEARIGSFARELVRFTLLHEMHNEFQVHLIRVIDRNR